MFITVSALIAAASSVTASAGNLDSSYDMNVLVIKYLHIDRNNQIIDPNVEVDGSWWWPGDISLKTGKYSFSDTKKSADDQVSAMLDAAEKGSAYLGYKYPGALPAPALRYRVIDTKEYSKAVPYTQFDFQDPKLGMWVDYMKIMRDHNICDYVDNKGVKEVWLLMANDRGEWHSESEMAGPYGNISNGRGRSMPICSKTYRIYNHTYDRPNLLTEGWGHQLEAEMEYVSRFARDAAGPGSGPDLFSLFNVACYDNSLAPCYPRGTMRLVAPSGGFVGEYFNNMTLSGSPVLTRTDANIRFIWDAGGPAPSLPVDQFSVRWTGWVVPEYSETYTFWTIADDGVRLKVFDGVTEATVIDSWKDQVAGFTGDIPLTAGQRYRVTMEYYENAGGAQIQLQWKSPSMPAQAKIARCGTVHNAPNAREEYDRSNTTPNLTDCMEWNPDILVPSSAKLFPISCDSNALSDPADPTSKWGWGCGKDGRDLTSYIFDNAELNYTKWHWQNMPGRNNSKSYQGKKLRNWWDIHGDFDGVMSGSNGYKSLFQDAATAPNPLPSLTLTASPASITPGQPSTLAWSTSNAGSCYASGNAGSWNNWRSVSGTETVSPSETTTYILTCSSATDTAARSVTVTVNPPPAITSFSPIFGQRDTIVTVYGTNFVPGLGQTAVSLNGVDAPIMQVVSPEILFFLVPKNAMTGKIKVTTPSGSVESATDFIVSCTLSNPITQVLTLGTGTGPTNEEIKVTFTGHIANAAALTANPPTTGVLYICPGTTVSYAVTATKGSLSCQRNNNRTAPTGSLRVNDNLVCNNITGGGGDVDKFFVRSQY